MNAIASRFAAGAAALIAAGVLAVPAHAAEPDINEYCKKFHPSGEVPRGLSPAMTVYFCWNRKGERPGPYGQLGHQRHIDMAEACKLTTGSYDFHYLGGLKIGCGKRPRIYIEPGPGVHILQAKDLTFYCGHALNPGARPRYSADLKRDFCAGASSPGPNPFTINFAVACSYVFKSANVNVRYVKHAGRHYVACVR